MVETFDIAPQDVWEMVSEHNVLISTFETGKEQRRYKGARPKQWKLTFKGKWGTIQEIIDFYNARGGSYESFNWTPPNGFGPISVRFSENSLSVTRYGLDIWGECSLTLQEVL